MLTLNEQLKTEMLKSRSQFCLFHTGSLLSDKQNKKALSVKVSKVGSDNETFVNFFFRKASFKQHLTLFLSSLIPE